MNVLMIMSILTLAPAAHAELPVIRLPSSYFQCSRDNDCAVAGDSCRSCGELIIINRRYLKKFRELDEKLRKKKKFVPACEACDTKRVVIKCVSNKCVQERRAP